VKTTPAPRRTTSTSHTKVQDKPQASVAQAAASRLAPVESPAPLPERLKDINNTGHCIAAFSTFLEEARPEEINLLRCLLMQHENFHRQKHIGDLMAHGFDLEEHKLDEIELRYMSACREIYRTNSGAATPAEKFLFTLIMLYTIRPVTPEEIQLSVKEFQEDFAICLSEVRAFAEKYHQLVTPGPNSVNPPTTSPAA
jgi:hypothetical protein